MGKINFVISDEVDKKFREEVFKRKGMKKGNLTEALEEALKLWIKSPVIKNLEEAVLSTVDGRTQIEGVKALGAEGESAIPSLSRIAKISQWAREEALKQINAIRSAQKQD